MNYLAIDTSGNYLTVAAVKDGRAFYSFVPDCAMKHSVTLMGEVEKVLSQAELSLDNCDFFAAVVGAGSFTGIRIGISAAKGFALACGKPTLAVTSFDTLAYNTLETDGAGAKNTATAKNALCLVDAMHGYYYACGYSGEKVTVQPAFLSEAEVLRFANDDFALYSGTEIPLSKKVEVTVVNPVAGLIAAVDAKCKNPENFGELTALYIRKSSAEINLEKGYKVH